MILAQRGPVPWLFQEQAWRVCSDTGSAAAGEAEGEGLDSEAPMFICCHLATAHCDESRAPP